jgi:membrane fusion protein, multidrug efflux system
MINPSMANSGSRTFGRVVSVSVLIAIGCTIYLLAMRSGKAGGIVSSEHGPAVHRVPVNAVQATLGDFERYLTELGTVTPINTVTVTSRVEGQIVKINFQEGQIVKAGDLLVQIDPRPFQVQLEQAEGQQVRDEAALKNDSLNLVRDRELYQDDVIPKQTLDAQVAAVTQDRGALVTDKANIDNAKLQLVYSRIAAPISGRIGLRMIDPGNIVQANASQPITTITQLQPISVVFTIPEDDVPAVVGNMQSHPMPVEAYDRSLDRKLADGSMLSFNNQIDTTTGTLKLKASFSNENNQLFPNQFVNVKLVMETLRDQVLIPAAALQRSSNGAFVYVVKPDNTVEMRNVTIGYTQAGVSAIKSGVATGERVVTQGVDRLQNGTLVSVQLATPGKGLAVQDVPGQSEL